MLTKEFIKSREVGKLGQHLLAETIRSLGAEVYEVPDGYFPDYDLKINNLKTVEVKYSATAHLTGNIVLEIRTLGYSKADVLAIAYGKPIMAFYLVPLNKAKKLADKWPVKKRIGTPPEECAIVRRSLFIELLKPGVITLPNE
jgi:hypothetical protein